MKPEASALIARMVRLEKAAQGAQPKARVWLATDGYHCTLDVQAGEVAHGIASLAGDAIAIVEAKVIAQLEALHADIAQHLKLLRA